MDRLTGKCMINGGMKDRHEEDEMNRQNGRWTDRCKMNGDVKDRHKEDAWTDRRTNMQADVR
jgi:hypothetical protein